jgi:hypothetical protein
MNPEETPAEFCERVAIGIEHMCLDTRTWDKFMSTLADECPTYASRKSTQHRRQCMTCALATVAFRLEQ